MRRRDILAAVPSLLAVGPGCAGAAGDGGFEVTPIVATQERVSRIGAYRLDGAWRVRSDDPRFGGLSTLEVANGELRAATDRGDLVRARLLQNEYGRIDGFADWSIAPFGVGERDDIESWARRPDGGFILGLERPNALVQFDPATGERTELPRPPGLRRAPRNEGMEAIAAFPDGSLLAFTEGLDLGDDMMRAWKLAPDGTPMMLRWPVDDGFVPVDAARDGDRLYVLERSASVLGGWRSRIRAVELATVPWAEEVVLESVEMARIDIDPYAENYEGIAVEALGDKRWLWLVSDDNFIVLQATKLLRLEVIEPAD